MKFHGNIQQYFIFATAQQKLEMPSTFISGTTIGVSLRLLLTSGSGNTAIGTD
jgi:hypothetical protein